MNEWMSEWKRSHLFRHHLLSNAEWKVESRILRLNVDYSYQQEQSIETWDVNRNTDEERNVEKKAKCNSINWLQSSSILIDALIPFFTVRYLLYNINDDWSALIHLLFLHLKFLMWRKLWFFHEKSDSIACTDHIQLLCKVLWIVMRSKYSLFVERKR